MACANESEPVKFDTLWNYSEPAETRSQFEALIGSSDEAYDFELKTQIARTYSLERDFDKSHVVLDEVAPYIGSSDRLATRYHLERGRAFNSAGDKDKAVAEFLKALAAAEAAGEEYFHVDAAHMLGIAEPGDAKREAWNLKAIEIAEGASDPRARGWRGALANNMGWDKFEAGDYDAALELFEKSRAAYEEMERPENERIARWAIAKVWRVTGKIEEALTEQHKQEKELADQGEVGGYVFEELGELYLIKGDEEKVKDYFAKAYAEISKDGWMMENEKERMARMKELGGLK